MDSAEAVQTLRQQACNLVLAKCTETFLPLCLTDKHDRKIYPTAGCTSDQELASDHYPIIAQSDGARLLLFAALLHLFSNASRSYFIYP